MSRLLAALLVAQGAASLLLLGRLARGRTRLPPVAPHHGGEPGPCVSIIVPTLDEAHRIAPLLDGVMAQGSSVGEIVFVDSGSTDGTRDIIARAQQRDARIRLESDPPLPEGWIGKAWALQHGATIARGPWLLGLDADTAPRRGLAAAAVAAADAQSLDVVSFAPRFAGQGALERWIQPAILATLVFRFGAAGTDVRADRIMANGQCFLVRRDVLLAHGGYAPVRASFAEDVSLARHLARCGARVAFLDGRLLYDVRSYESARQMWREWGRSVDLKDATTPLRQVGDVVFLVLVQALPLVVLAALLATGMPATPQSTAIGTALLALNLLLLLVRWLLAFAMAPSYATRGLAFWLNPLADPLAVLRVAWSSLRRPRRWRSRAY